MNILKKIIYMLIISAVLASTAATASANPEEYVLLDKSSGNTWHISGINISAEGPITKFLAAVHYDPATQSNYLAVYNRSPGTRPLEMIKPSFDLSTMTYEFAGVGWATYTPAVGKSLGYYTIRAPGFRMEYATGKG